jgi:hypothetical protein
MASRVRYPATTLETQDLLAQYLDGSKLRAARGGDVMVMCVPDKPSLHGPIIIKNRPYRTAHGRRMPHLLGHRRG